jgi:hypothetical protein
MNENPTVTDPFGEVIYSYTRTEAIADGVLVDVSETAREAGFRWPVAITSAAWADCVAWSEKDNRRQVHQDEPGRLWDVLWMALNAIRTNPPGTQMTFELYRVPCDGISTEARPTRLKLVAGPSDAGEPVITLMLPGED